MWMDGCIVGGVYGYGGFTLYTMVVWDGVRVEGGWVPLLKMSILLC